MLGWTKGDRVRPAHTRSRERISAGQLRVIGAVLETSPEKERIQKVTDVATVDRSVG